MKKNHFYSLIIALASMAFVACSSDDNDGKLPAGIPDKAKASTEFTLGKIENEKYADDDDDDWMDMTIRFDGKQMRAYANYIDKENNITFYAYSVSTFSARYE